VSQRQFLEAEMRQRVSDVVRQIEAETSVEVVVSVQKAASRYVVAWVRAGAIAGFLAFATMMLSPTYYAVWLILVDSLLAALLGALLCARWPRLKHWLSRAAERRSATAAAANTAFQNLGIDKTRDRSGLLVFVALFEGDVLLKPDTGIDVELLGPGFDAATLALRSAVLAFDSEAFLTALAGLARPLADAHPRRPDDTNELADEMA
jgi:putative membrane protein